MPPYFAIILPSYRRPEACLHAILSLRAQTNTSWQTIIIIDDPVTDYTAVEKAVADDTRFVILKNETNLGKNASVNRAFAWLRTHDFAGHIIFLDDDDWLTPTCLDEFATLITSHPEHQWFVINRTAAQSNIPFTKNLTGKTIISYYTDSLLTRRFSGDATHCLYFPSVQNASFPLSVKNAEEWLYFAHVAQSIPRFWYANVTGTLSHGYSETGLTDIYHQAAERNQNTIPLSKEACARHLYHPIVWCYLGYRLLRRLL